MSIAQASLAVTAGQSYTVNVGSQGTVGAVVVINESPYGLNVSNGSSSQWIPAQAADLVLCNSMGFNGSLTITTDNYLNNASDAPSFLIYFTSFAPGEAIPGSYPAALMRLSSGGGGVASAIVNDGAPSGTNIIESTPAGATQSYWLARNDGTLQVWALSNNTLTELINLTPGSSSAAASLALKLLETVGVLKIDSGGITTDGNGNLTVGNSGFNSSGTVKALELLLHLNRGGGVGDETCTVQFGGGSGNDLVLTLGGNNSGAGIYDSFQFYTVYNGNAANNNFGIGVQGGATNPASWIDQNGVLHAAGPVTLASGSQETGQWGLQVPGTASHNISTLISFKTMMTNAPSSINSTTLATNNASAPNFNTFTKYGANLYWTAIATGDTGLNIQYTTVGNCLLAVDAQARTLDHHCDICGHLSQGASFDQVNAIAGAMPALHAVNFTCPACGAIEHFNGGMTSADEADTTPQGSGQYATTRGAQATLIRQLMTGLGLEVAP